MAIYGVAIGLLTLAYLLGSLPTGYLVGKAKGIDIRDHGSGSTGATNVWRTIGRKEGIFVWLIDSGKGFLATFLAIHSDPLLQALSLPSPLPHRSWWVVAASLFALLGHSRPVWLGFQGGKSVATGLGVLLALNPIVAGGAFGLWLATMALWRTVSISSILAAVATPLLMYFSNRELAYLLFAITGGAFVVWRHSSNIERILQGTEPQLSFGSKEQEAL